MDTVVSELEQLNGSTEAGFLAVGEKLMQFLTQAREIASQVSGLGEFISGRHGQSACQALRGTLDGATRLLDQARETDQALAQLRLSARHIRTTFAGFNQVVSSFQLLATMTRIETARLGNSGTDFSYLADQVASLTGDIKTRVAGVLEAASCLERSVGAALEGVSNLGERQLRQLPELAAAVTSRLEAMETRQAQASEASSRLSGELSSVSSGIEALVTSIQFHDITRQQIEHVVEALRVLSGEGGALTADRAAVVRLQNSQLSNASGAFTAATSQIDRDLESIAAQVREMLAESHTVLGPSADEQEAFFGELEACFGEILRATTEWSDLARETAAAGAELGKTLEEMGAALEQIRTIELQVDRLSLNARIRACQIGNWGDALNVVAEGMSTLTADCDARSREAEGILCRMSALLATLAEEAAGAQESSRSAAEVKTRVQDLRSSRSEAARLAAQVTAAAAAFCEEVDSLRAGFTMGERMAETVAGCDSRLRALVPQVEEASTGDRSRQLEDFARNYTMGSERQIHEAVAAGRDVVLETVPPTDDNVELF